jgi:hypothetical protein
MKVLIFVPSRSRPEQLKQFTYSWLQHTDKDFVIVVEPQQAEMYKDFKNLLIMDKNDGGLGYATHFVREYALKNGYDVVFKIDDDIQQFVNYRGTFGDTERGSIERQKLCYERFEKAYENAVKLLQKNRAIGAIGFPYRGEMFPDLKPVTFGKLQTCYLVRTECYDPEPDWQSQEDFVAYINVVGMGYKVARLNTHGLDLGIEVGMGEGGIQDFDREALTKAEMPLIKAKYPNVVFKYKPNRPWKYEIDFVKSKFERK